MGAAKEARHPALCALASRRCQAVALGVPSVRPGGPGRPGGWSRCVRPMHTSSRAQRWGRPARSPALSRGWSGVHPALRRCAARTHGASTRQQRPNVQGVAKAVLRLHGELHAPNLHKQPERSQDCGERGPDGWSRRRCGGRLVHSRHAPQRCPVPKAWDGGMRLHRKEALARTLAFRWWSWRPPGGAGGTGLGIPHCLRPDVQRRALCVRHGRSAASAVRPERNPCTPTGR